MGPTMNTAPTPEIGRPPPRETAEPGCTGRSGMGLVWRRPVVRSLDRRFISLGVVGNPAVTEGTP